MFQAHHGPQVSAQQLLTAVDDELQLLATEGVGEDELARVQARIAAQLLRQADPVLGRTQSFAAGELIHGRAEFATELPGRLAAVTADSIADAAAHLREQHRAVLELKPGAVA